jgi:hypothetical protein
MWEVMGGRKKRRMDFASPYLEHGKATAVLWYGEPQTGWHELKETKTATSRRARRKITNMKDAKEVLRYRGID